MTTTKTDAPLYASSRLGELVDAIAELEPCTQKQLIARLGWSQPVVSRGLKEAQRIGCITRVENAGTPERRGKPPHLYQLG